MHLLPSASGCPWWLRGVQRRTRDFRFGVFRGSGVGGKRELGEKRGKEPKWPEGGGLIVLLLCMGRLPIDRRGRHHTEALISIWVVRPHGKLRLGAQSLPEGLLARHESERVGRDYHAEDWPVG